MSRAPRAPAAVLEEIAGRVMAADASDATAVRGLERLLEELAAAVAPSDPAAVRTQAGECLAALRAGLAAGTPALTAALDAVSEATARMQDAVARPGRLPAPPATGLVLPEWGDEKTLREFIAGARGALEEMEASVLAMERGDAGERAAFRRRLHTLKGEAGVLGLEDLEKVAHALEDLLEGGAAPADLADRLLKVRDWMGRALDAYSRLVLPEPRAAAVIDAWIVRGAVPPAPPPEPPAAASGAEERVERDAETVGLFGEFLAESGDGLTRVDEILMNVEREGAGADSVNALFRVFHTIKGTAGFLDLSRVVELAHAAETMLNRCREGGLLLQGAVVDLAFDASASCRRTLESIRGAIEAGTAFPDPGDLSELLRRLEAAAAGRPGPEKPLPAALPGERLGEVIQRTGVPPQAVEAALRKQAASGRRLGEELVALGAARPEDVARALRAQGRAEKEAAGDGAAKLKETIRVDLERVDSLVEMIGELVVVESMVVNAPEIGGAGSVRVRNMLAQLAKVTRDLQDVGMRMRMVPVLGVFQKMARMVRDLSRKSGKPVRLETAGEWTEMDRNMVERVADPLVHMIRNSMDHGIEGPEERAAAGKPATGTIRLSACQEGGGVVIEIADDGRGLDRERIAEKAVERGLIRSAEGLSEADVDRLIFAPGFSTAAQVTEISGRGVGMDVVKRNIEALRGRVVVSSRPGAGTRFRLVLPLTLAIIDGMLVATGKERYIVPTLSIVESIQPDRSMLLTLGGASEMINLRGEILPLVRLDRLCGLTGARSDPTEALAVVVEGAGRRFGILVDEVVAQQQVVIKSVGAGLPSTPFVSGAAILSDGRVGLILNVEEISALVHRGTRAAARDTRAREWAASGAPPEAGPPPAAAPA